MGNDQGAAGYEERARSRKGLERRPQRGAKLGRRKATANLTGMAACNNNTRRFGNKLQESCTDVVAYRPPSEG
jgi:hypothetical protein